MNQTRQVSVLALTSCFFGNTQVGQTVFYNDIHGYERDRINAKNNNFEPKDAFQVVEIKASEKFTLFTVKDSNGKIHEDLNSVIFSLRHEENGQEYVDVEC